MKRLKSSRIFILSGFALLYGMGLGACGAGLLSSSNDAEPTQVELDAQTKECLLGTWSGNLVEPLDMPSPGVQSTEIKSDGTLVRSLELGSPISYRFTVSNGVFSVVTEDGVFRKDFAIGCEGDFASTYLLTGGNTQTLVGEWRLLSPILEYDGDSASTPDARRDATWTFADGGGGTLREQSVYFDPTTGADYDLSDTTSAITWSQSGGSISTIFAGGGSPQVRTYRILNGHLAWNPVQRSSRTQAP